MTATRLHRLLAACAMSALVAGVGSARAETTAAERAAAEGLFQQGMTLLDQKKYNEACEKLAGSQELDPALGTMLYLADCYEHAGKTASAWALFHEAADTAKRTNQGDRERMAAERAASLEQRLSKLNLRVVGPARVTGLEVLVNGVAVPSASWNAPLPVDPGKTKIVARAPGKKPWTTEVDLRPGPAQKTVDVARLVDAPKPPPGAAGQAHDANRGKSQRLMGYVLSGAGVVALAAGGFFGYRAYSWNKRSKGQCRADDPNACTTSGVELREDAKTAAALSTIATVGGGAMVVSGITLVVTAPSPSDRDEGRAARSNFPNVGLIVRGAF